MRCFIFFIPFLIACDAGIGPDPTDTGGTSQASSGAGGGSTIGGGYESGSRLKAQTHVGDDGSRTPLTAMFDSELGVECYFAVAADGVTRCLPFGGPTVGQYYLDAACTQPLAYSPSCPVAGGYVSIRDTTCSPRAQVFPIGSLVTPAGVYLKQGTNCTSTAVTAGAFYYSVGAEVPAASFVAATVEVEP